MDKVNPIEESELGQVSGGYAGRGPDFDDQRPTSIRNPKRPRGSTGPTFPQPPEDFGL